MTFYDPQYAVRVSRFVVHGSRCAFRVVYCPTIPCPTETDGSLGSKLVIGEEEAVRVMPEKVSVAEASVSLSIVM